MLFFDLLHPDSKYDKTRQLCSCVFMAFCSVRSGSVFFKFETASNLKIVRFFVELQSLSGSFSEQITAAGNLSVSSLKPAFRVVQLAS